MNLPLDTVDPKGLVEYSVVFSDRSLNHMSAKFVDAMQDMLGILRDTYNAHSAAIVPGGGSFAMESVARQFANDAKTLVLRNGFFSYRWTQIIETGKLTDQHRVLKAKQVSTEAGAPTFEPMDIKDATAAIAEYEPDVVFAPHVETASGILISDDYITQLAEATHKVGGVFVLDCVASGTLWVDMKKTGVDVLISAPQKGWSGSPAAGYVLFSENGRKAMEDTQTSSFAMDLKKWTAIADGYVDGGAGYHATMATDTLLHNLELMKEAQEVGLETLRAKQEELGGKVRELFAERGYTSVAAPGCEAPSVVVVNAKDPQKNYVAAFKEAGLQIAGGVPLMIDEPEGLATFRIGLFGLDKWADVDAAVQRLADALDKIE